jgi:hypothetical protein
MVGGGLIAVLLREGPKYEKTSKEVEKNNKFSQKNTKTKKGEIRGDSP